MRSETKEKEEIITKSGKVWIEDGIIRSKVSIKDEYTIEHAMEDAEAFRKLAEKIADKKLLLVEPGNIFKISLKTRSYQATEGPKIVNKLAMVVDNPVARVIASFFLGLSKMAIPTKIFDTVAEAVKWLKER